MTVALSFVRYLDAARFGKVAGPLYMRASAIKAQGEAICKRQRFLYMQNNHAERRTRMSNIRPLASLPLRSSIAVPPGPPQADLML